MDNLQTQLDDVLIEIDERIAAWEEEQQAVEEEEEAAINVKWSHDIEANYLETDVRIDYWQTPSRMESEGDYTIKVTLTNLKIEAITDYELYITYTPNGKPYVDNNSTFLDTINSPYTLWDTEIVTRDEYCRRISCSSEKIKLNASEELQLKLEFVLTYK